MGAVRDLEMERSRLGSPVRQVGLDLKSPECQADGWAGFYRR